MPRGLDQAMICAIDRRSNDNSRSDACFGDSGVPLIMDSGGEDKILAGVTSFGQSCGGPHPSVYTAVYNYLDWIEKIVWPELLRS